MAPRLESNHSDEALVNMDPTGKSTTPSPSTTPTKDRTVLDYQTTKEVEDALDELDLSLGDEKDWELQQYEVDTTIPEPNNRELEAKRLMCLKSYNILDTEKEVEFEAITNDAKNFFDVPIAVVSLIDMGRQWFKSIQGLAGVESTPRCVAFCAHVIKRDISAVGVSRVMVVKDATKDPRFQSNPLVTGGPQIRFYAGAPLLSPEGAMLGTICIIDFEPHPEGLSEAEEDRLEVLAQEVVFEMIARTE